MPQANTRIANDYPNNVHNIVREQLPEHLIIKGFTPSPRLLEFLRISSYRFWRIYRCEEDVTTIEAKRFAKWLEKDVSEIFPHVQTSQNHVNQ